MEERERWQHAIAKRNSAQEGLKRGCVAPTNAQYPVGANAHTTEQIRQRMHNRSGTDAPTRSTQNVACDQKATTTRTTTELAQMPARQSRFGNECTIAAMAEQIR